MERVSLTILNKQSFGEDFYIESIQNPEERSKNDFWLCRNNSRRKLFLGSAQDDQAGRSRMKSLAKEKIVLLA